MDKKIGIMSMQRIINYGSFLQAYGLKKMIESVSKSEVEFVDYRFGIDITDRLKKPQAQKESVVDKVLKNRTPWNYLKKKRFFKEIERRLIQDLKTIGVDELNYDCMVDTLVIGSDEVFNCIQSYPVGYSKQLFGDGYEDNKLVSYAASFGSTCYEDLVNTGIEKEIKIMLSKLQLFLYETRIVHILLNNCSVMPRKYIWIQFLCMISHKKLRRIRLTKKITLFYMHIQGD